MQWFSEARKLDDRLNRRLGTLGYLPWDIREMIWCMAIDEYKVLFWGKWHWAWVDEGLLRSPLDFKRDPECDESRPNDEISGLDIFDLCSYLGLSSFGDGTMDLRLASPQVKIELESAFIFRNAFRFFCPILMDHFLNQLSAHHRPLLRSINLMLFGCWDSCDPDTGSITSDCRAWVAVIERLPATIQFVTLDIGTYRMPCGMQYNHSYDIKMIVALLEVMTKKVQRQAPRAKISVPALKDYWCDSDKELLQIMFDELEPFSEDFKKWSDQSRKNAME